ncbi:MAG: GTP-binding protein [Deltaproteobacteria bacterium]|nr:GTP-binding protein [Deltaproteobacteria bacterium]
MKTKVLIITGFLGAGKTTLVKRILKFSSDLSRTIVLVNEFGKVGIDRALIKKTSTADIVELKSGCICCSLRTDMIQALQILRHQYMPERLIIEATGVADPLSVIEALNDRMLLPYFRLEKTITVVDSDFWEARGAFGTVFKSQVKQADIILLNKIDVLDKSLVPVILKEIQEESAACLIIPTLHCNIDPDIIWFGPDQEVQGIAPGSLFQAYDPETDFYSSRDGKGTMTAKEAGFISFSFETTMSLDEKRFMAFLNTAPLELFRIKGLVRFAGGTKMLNFVGGKIQLQKWSGPAFTCLAFIGWNVIEERILEELNKCIARE